MLWSSSSLLRALYSTGLFRDSTAFAGMIPDGFGVAVGRLLFFLALGCFGLAAGFWGIKGRKSRG